MKNQRSLESLALSSAVKYGGKAVYRRLPQLKIIFNLILVRLFLKDKVEFKHKYMFIASRWADRMGLQKTYRYTFSFPVGLKMHRAIDVSEYDNSDSVTIMSFTEKK